MTQPQSVLDRIGQIQAQLEQIEATVMAEISQMRRTDLAVRVAETRGRLLGLRKQEGEGK